MTPKLEMIAGPKNVALDPKLVVPSVISANVPLTEGSPTIKGTLRDPPPWLMVIGPPPSPPAVDTPAFVPF